MNDSRIGSSRINQDLLAAAVVNPSVTIDQPSNNDNNKALRSLGTIKYQGDDDERSLDVAPSSIDEPSYIGALSYPPSSDFTSFTVTNISSPRKRYRCGEDSFDTNNNLNIKDCDRIGWQSCPVALQKGDASPSAASWESTRPSSSPRESQCSRKKRKVNSDAMSKKDRRWLSMLDELKKYKTEYGDCVVPRGFPFNPALASWVAEQRKQYRLLRCGRQSSITEDRVALLNELGFAWNAQEAAWSKHFNNLQLYMKEHGNCMVPLNSSEYPQLGLWVKEQRRHYTLMIQGKHSHMTKERAKALKDIGFCWDSHETVWWERYHELEEYKALHGHCLVPTKYDPNRKLGTWVHHQRRQYKLFREGETSHMTKERVQALEKIEFVWFPRRGGKRKLKGGASGIEEQEKSNDCQEDDSSSFNNDLNDSSSISSEEDTNFSSASSQHD